jgi:hypothetical protein
MCIIAFAKAPHVSARCYRKARTQVAGGKWHPDMEVIIIIIIVIMGHAVA